MKRKNLGALVAAELFTAARDLIVGHGQQGRSAASHVPNWTEQINNLIEETIEKMRLVKGT